MGSSKDVCKTGEHKGWAGCCKCTSRKLLFAEGLSAAQAEVMLSDAGGGLLPEASGMFFSAPSDEYRDVHLYSVNSDAVLDASALADAVFDASDL